MNRKFMYMVLCQPSIYKVYSQKCIISICREFIHVFVIVAATVLAV